MLRASLIVTLTLVLAPGCTSDGGSGDDDVAGSDGGSSGGVDGGGTGGPDGGTDPQGWSTLVDGAWTVPGGTETYRCVYKTIPETMYISGFKALIPDGTHHTVLTIGDKTREDGIANCNAGTNYDRQVFGSGVGTGEVEFPAGVALKVEAGQQLLLNLHLFNFGDGELAGTSGTLIKTIPANEVQHEAEALMMGDFNLNLPPNQVSTEIGECVMNGDVTIFAMQPHMHMLGIHMKVEAGSTVIWDEDYSFDEQVVRRVGPVSLSSGEKVRVHCTYNNTTDDIVRFGDSSYDEMCIAGIFRYPARGSVFGPFCGSF